MPEQKRVKFYKGIPQIFKPHNSQEAFSNCMICNKYLLVNGVQYLIEKMIKKYKGYQVQDVIFEYAICLECAVSMRKTLSEESLQRIEQYMIGRIDYECRFRLLEAEGEPDINNWLSRCLIKGTSVEDLSEYQIIGAFEGEQMILSDTPYLISGEVSEELQELLSQKTKDELDNFRNTYLGPSPEFEDLLKQKKLIFL